MTADMSVAPEIARLAEAVVLAPARPPAQFPAEPPTRFPVEPPTRFPAEPPARFPAKPDAGDPHAAQATAGPHAAQAIAGDPHAAQAIAADPHAAQATAGPLTLGTLARTLRTIAASPERWWGMVRFHPDRSVRIELEDQPEYGAWLVVMPPGDTGRDCDCDVATIIAGEATDGVPGGATLRPGPTRVHGQRHRLQGRGAGYSISLHARARRPRTAMPGGSRSPARS